jgi:CspA family cold shock protein
MLKIVHLLMGAAALLLSFIPACNPKPSLTCNNRCALYLAFFGLLNLALAPVIPYWNKRPAPSIAKPGQRPAGAGCCPANPDPDRTDAGDRRPTSRSVQPGAALIAVVLHLAISFYKSSPATTSQTYDMSNRDTGTVKWFNTSRLRLYFPDSGDDIFVHFRPFAAKATASWSKANAEFSVMNRDKGLQAEDVIAALPRR